MPIIQELLREDYSIEQAKSIQVKYQKIIKQIQEISYITNVKSIKTIAGLDISYYKKEDYEYGVACAVIWNLKQERIENYYFIKDFIRFPYKSGFLGFRECKLLAKVILKIPNTPDLIMCDGHGKIHPRRFGEAVHLGVALNIASIGIAKNPYIGYSDWNQIEKIKGNKTPVWLRAPDKLSERLSNEILGYAVCLNNGSKPVFVSVGYRIMIDTALKICLLTTKDHRQPEPLYLADHYSKEKVKELII